MFLVPDIPVAVMILTTIRASYRGGVCMPTYIGLSSTAVMKAVERIPPIASPFQSHGSDESEGSED